MAKRKAKPTPAPAVEPTLDPMPAPLFTPGYCPPPALDDLDLEGFTEDWWNHQELGRIARYYRAYPDRLTARVRERIQALAELLKVGEG